MSTIEQLNRLHTCMYPILAELDQWGVIKKNGYIVSSEAHTVQPEAWWTDKRKASAAELKHRSFDSYRGKPSSFSTALQSCHDNGFDGVAMWFDYNSPFCVVRFTPPSIIARDYGAEAGAKAKQLQVDWCARGFAIIKGKSIVPERALFGVPHLCEQLGFEIFHSGHLRFRLDHPFQDMTKCQSDSLAWLASHIISPTLEPTDNHNLDVALGLAASGFRVFPTSTAKGNKKPLVSGWPVDATAKPSQIKRWWNTFPDAAVSLHVGSNGLVVFDLDIRPADPAKATPAKDGIAAFDRVCTETGFDKSKCFIVGTQNGGEHVYAKCAPNTQLSNWVSKVGDGIDIRTNNGQTVAPEVVTVEGKPYSILTPDIALSDTYQVTPEMDAHLADIAQSNMAKKKPRKSRPAGSPIRAPRPQRERTAEDLLYGELADLLLLQFNGGVSASTRSKMDNYLAAAIANAYDTIEAAIEGERTSTLFSAGAALAGYVPYGFTNFDELEEMLIAATDINSWRDHSEDDLKTALNSIATKYTDRPALFNKSINDAIIHGLDPVVSMAVMEGGGFEFATKWPDGRVQAGQWPVQPTIGQVRARELNRMLFG